jgi:hypothetical protein
MRKEVLGVLTDEQKTLVKERMRREHGGKHGAARHGDGTRTG